MNLRIILVCQYNVECIDKLHGNYLYLLELSNYEKLDNFFNVLQVFEVFLILSKFSMIFHYLILEYHPLDTSTKCNTSLYAKRENFKCFQNVGVTKMADRFHIYISFYISSTFPSDQILR